MSGAGIVVIVAIVVIAGWWLDVRRHPIRRCPSCNGSKRNTSNSQRWGTCRRCGGKGEVRRFGAPGE
jgi:DnaJ-class molecular chaperone